MERKAGKKNRWDFYCLLFVRLEATALSYRESCCLIWCNNANFCILSADAAAAVLSATKKWFLVELIVIVGRGCRGRIQCWCRRMAIKKTRCAKKTEYDVVALPLCCWLPPLFGVAMCFFPENWTSRWFRDIRGGEVRNEAKSPREESGKTVGFLPTG